MAVLKGDFQDYDLAVSVNPSMKLGNTEGTRTGDSVETAREALPEPQASGIDAWQVVGEDTVRSAPMVKAQRVAEMTILHSRSGITECNFMRYNNLPTASQLVEGVRMQTTALTASQYSITVAEHGAGVAVSELLLNASFDDVMASASRLLGRQMAQYLDTQCRDTLLGATSVVYGYDRSSVSGAQDFYNPGSAATSRAGLTGAHYLSPHAVKDAIQTLSMKNVPRLGETYVAFVSPAQSRRLRDTPEFIEVTKYAAPGNFMLGEIGRLYDVVFIETTQVRKVTNGAGSGWSADTTVNGVTTGNGNKDRYDAIVIGDNAFGHAISLPVELRDGGVLDFGLTQNADQSAFALAA